MRLVSLSFLFVLFVGFGCGDKGAVEVSKDPLPLETYFPMKIGSVDLELQVALAMPEQRSGLMHRTELPENGGMLFAYTTPRRARFWMKNTKIPLDIGFFDQSGELLEVARMYPLDLRSVSSASDQVAFAVEMSLGWFGKAGVVPGDRMDLGRLSQAIAARGVDPKDYGL